MRPLQPKELPKEPVCLRLSFFDSLFNLHLFLEFFIICANRIVVLSSLLFALYGESLRRYVQRVAQRALGISIYYHIGRIIHSIYNLNIIHWLCQYICVFYAKNFFCMNRQYLFRGFWSREAFFDKTTEMFADLRSGCGRAASLADLRSGCGRAASLADLRSGCGRAASLAPTADARRPSRLRRSLRK